MPKYEFDLQEYRLEMNKFLRILKKENMWKIHIKNENRHGSTPP
jgi:hypothetical protein